MLLDPLVPPSIWSQSKITNLPSQLIVPLGTTARVLIVMSNVPLIAPVNYSPANQFVIDILASGSSQSLFQINAKRTVSSGHQPGMKPVLIVVGNGVSSSEISEAIRTCRVYKPDDPADVEDRKERKRCVG